MLRLDCHQDAALVISMVVISVKYIRKVASAIVIIVFIIKTVVLMSRLIYSAIQGQG